MNNANEKKNSGLNKKYLKIGSFSIAMSAVAVAVVIVINLIAASLPTTYTKYDLSSLGMYTIGEESRAIIDGVDDDVVFYLVAQRGAEDSTIVEFLDRYAAMNPHITVKTVDPVANPAFISEYTTEELSQNSVIAVSGKRSYAVDYNDIYTREYSDEELYNYYYYGQMPTGTPYFNGELAVTTALDYVTRDDIPKLYTLTGHGETALDETYLGYIDTENIEVSSLSVLSDEPIPSDCSSILINNPTSDISSAECEKLISYLDEGGGIILITGALTYNSGAMPNITAVAKHMGLEPVDGLIIETAAKKYMMYQYYLLPTLGSTSREPLSLLQSGDIYVLASASHGIISDGSHSVNPLLTTSSGAYAKEVTANMSGTALDKADGDITGTFYVGASSDADASGSRSDTSKLVWFSTPDISSSSADQWVSGGNSSVFMASVGWMCENKINLSIMAKQMQVEALTVTAADSALWTIVLTVVIPAVVFVSGFVVWYKRRKK